MIPKQFFRFRLRTLLILLSAVAVVLAILSIRANRQRRAVNAIGQSGHVVYHHEFPYEDFFGEADYTVSPKVPTWIRKIVGDDYFQTVRMVTFSPTDEIMAHLSQLPNIESITIDAHQLSDAGFGKLADIPNLRRGSIKGDGGN